MRYEFILIYLGEEIGRESFNNYNKARRFFYYEYFRLDRGCRVFVEGEEMNIFKAYDYFNLVEYSLDYIFHKSLPKEDYY